MTETHAPVAPVEDLEMFHRPGEPEYATATRAFNLTGQAAARGATLATSESEVVAALRHCRRHHLAVRVASTMHGATGKGPLTDAMLIRTEIDRPPSVNGAQRTMRVPAGTRWAAVVEAAAEHDLAAVHGSSGAVGAVGYLLRGGVSFYGRHLGLGVNSLRSVTIVLADGETVVASETREADLFWALRGGGGGLGIVTEVEIDLHPMSAIVTGSAIWDARLAETIVPEWRRWATDAPPEASTSMRLMNLTGMPGVPPELTRGQVLVIDGAIVVQSARDQDRADAYAADLLAPLRALGTPMVDTWHTASAPELLATHMDPQDPLPYVGDHSLLRDLGDDGIGAFLSAAGPDSGSTLTIAELRQLGGRFASPRAPGGAMDRTDAAFAHLAISVTPTEAAAAAALADLERVRAAVGPWATGMTIASAVESFTALQRSYDDETAHRVEVIRQRADPAGMFRGDVEAVRDLATP